MPELFFSAEFLPATAGAVLLCAATAAAKKHLLRSLSKKQRGGEKVKMIQVTLKIDGMMCGMCESHINDCIRSHFQIKKVTSSHTKGETIITAETAPDLDKLKAAIAETGYTVTDAKVETIEKKSGLFGLFGKK